VIGTGVDRLSIVLQTLTRPIQLACFELALSPSNSKDNSNSSSQTVERKAPAMLIADDLNSLSLGSLVDDKLAIDRVLSRF
jgi:hypothetical protein